MNNLSASKSKEAYRRIDSEFKHELAKLHNGDTLKFCYQCGSCTANCCLSRLLSVYRPNKILELAKLGIKNVPQSGAFFLCSACTKCTKGCPQGVKVHEIMHGLKELAIKDKTARDYLLNEFEKTLSAFAEEIPFPISYSWISLSPSENEAENGEFNALAKNVLYRCLERFRNDEKLTPEAVADKVAVIGSGPAGLTAAWELCKAGLSVTVFEPLPEAGGMLAVGIPSYRLPKDVVAAEITNIKAMGVEIKTGVPVDKELFDSILNGGEYRAVFVATGAPSNRNLRIEGENLEGVVPVLDFLREFNLNNPISTGKKAVVIGGGNVGIDAARTALRCGAETVQLFCLEDRNEMPSHKWEIEEAVREGVILNPSWGPKAINGDGGKVRGVEFIRCKSVFDGNGKFAPVFDEKSTQNVEADTVITAIGQAPSLDFLGQAVDTNRGAITVDPLTMETSLPGVYAGGDNVSGTASFIEAIVAGRTAAASIIQYLNKNLKKG